jgi:glycosyltransferase involved in cell wall biosynthesis
MKRLRILQVGKFFPPPFGGMETVLYNLIQVLARDVEIEVVVAHTINRNETVVQENTIIHKVRSLGTLAGTSICPTMPYVLWRMLRKRHFDVVHIHLPNPTGHLALRLAMPKDTKLVVTWHSDIIRQKRMMVFYLPLLRNFLKRADAVLAATPKNFSSSTQIETASYPEKLHALPFGIDLDAYLETPSVMTRAREIRAKFGNEIIFACGRHIYYKGFEYLIQAMPKIRQGTLLLGGRGPMSQELEVLAKRIGCAARVHFLGFIPQEEIAAYYHASAVVAMPSVDKSEAFGMVQLEAMICGKPVVCCELHNGVSYVNQHGVTGLVVEPRNPDVLADALNSLMENPRLREKMGIAGRQRVQKEFSLEAMRAAHLNLFSELTGRRPFHHAAG